MMNSKIIRAIIVMLLPFSINLNAQKEIQISGQILDATTREPLPFVSVFFKNTDIGTDTGLDGKYKLKTIYPTDTLGIAYLGYREDFTWINRREDSLVKPN